MNPNSAARIARRSGTGPSPGAPRMAGIGGARPHGAGSWKFSATAPKPLCRTEESPPRPPSSGKPARPESSSRNRAALARPQRFCGSGSTGGLPARALPSARHPPSPSGLRARPAGEGTGREVRTRTSERPARPAEPQAGSEQDKAASPEPPHPAAAAPRPALAPGGRRATCTGPSPPAALTGSLARGRRPQPARGAGPGRGEPFATCSCCTSSAFVFPLRSAAFRPMVKSDGAGARVPAPRQEPEDTAYVALALRGKICRGVKCASRRW